jgi:hypothetical protein
MDFDIKDFEMTNAAYDRRPSWLMRDINDMMQNTVEKIGLHMSEVERLAERTAPEKSDLYKNFKKEMTPTSSKNALKYEMRIKKAQNQLEEASQSEKKVRMFIKRVQEDRHKKRIAHNTYMQKAFDKPFREPALPERLVSPRPISARQLRPLSPPQRPNTAPSTRDDQELRSRLSRPSSPNSIEKRPCLVNRRASDAMALSLSVNNLPDRDAYFIAMQQLCKFVKIIRFADTSRRMLLIHRAQLKGMKIFATKIQRWYRRGSESRSIRYRNAMPKCFMRYVLRFMKRIATKRLTTFLREFSSIRSHNVVRGFLVCVRKSQRIIRDCIEVKRARVQLLNLYWEKTERIARKQIEEQEKEHFHHLQKERFARLGRSTTSDVHGRWSLTHKQVRSTEQGSLCNNI